MTDKNKIKIKLPEYVQKLIMLLKGKGFDAYAVGGCIRDSIMGTQPNDWDVCTNAVADKIDEILNGSAKVFPTGIKHGTVTVILNEFRANPIELTTFRTERDYDDCRHPKSVEFVSEITEDLKRRDFTVNAMAYNDDDGLIDLFGGRDDLNNGVIRCVGDAETRFSEDALRIMRAMRFAAVCGFDIDENTLAAMYEKRTLLKNISKERIFAELKKLVCGKDAADILKLNKKILAVILPECFSNGDTAYENLDMLKYLPNDKENVCLRLAAVFLPSGEKSSCLLRRLKADNVSRVSVKLLTDKFGGANTPKPPQTKRAGLDFLRKYGFKDSISLLVFGRAYAMAQKRPSYEWNRAAEIVRNIENSGECYSISKLDINGGDLIKLGIEGVEIGKGLELLLDAVITEKVPNQKEKLESFITDYFRL